MGTFTGFVLRCLVGPRPGAERRQPVEEPAQNTAGSDPTRTGRESAAEMLHSALVATGDGRPDWRVVASPELFTGVVSRGQALVSGSARRIPPARTPRAP